MAERQVTSTVAVFQFAALYVRVSTDGQTVENQIRELTQIAQRRGWKIVHTYQERLDFFSFAVYDNAPVSTALAGQLFDAEIMLDPGSANPSLARRGCTTLCAYCKYTAYDRNANICGHANSRPSQNAKF